MAAASSDCMIEGKTYRLTRMPTMQAMECARRYGQVLVFVGDVRAKTEAANGPAAVTPPNMGKAMLLAASEISAADQAFVVGTCLSVVYRLEGDKAVPVRDPSGKLQFEQDMTPLAIAELVYRVMEDHQLISFFGDNAPASPGARPA